MNLEGTGRAPRIAMQFIASGDRAAETVMANRNLYRAIYIPSGAGLLGAMLYFQAQPYSLPGPDKMKRWAMDDKTFSIEHPGNWKAQSISVHGTEAMVKFEP